MLLFPNPLKPYIETAPITYEDKYHIMTLDEYIHRTENSQCFPAYIDPDDNFEDYTNKKPKRPTSGRRTNKNYSKNDYSEDLEDESLSFDQSQEMSIHLSTVDEDEEDNYKEKSTTNEKNRFYEDNNSRRVIKDEDTFRIL